MEKKDYWKFEIGSWNLEIRSPISNFQSRISNRVLFFLWLLWLSPLTGFSLQQDSPLDLHSIPISDWLNGTDHADIPWDVRVREPYLRIDQRLEFSYSLLINAKDLNKTGSRHELFLISRISTPDGEWLNQPSILHENVEEELARRLQVQFTN